MFCLKSVLLSAIALFSVSSFAELITIKTTNGEFQIHKDTILNGPDGFLKNALKHSSEMSSTLSKDGSLTVEVDQKSMKIALLYIRSGKIAHDLIQKSSLLMSDMKFLFPGIKLVLKKKVTRKSKIWKCGAYCYNRGVGYKFHTVSNKDLFKAWEELNTFAQEYYPLQKAFLPRSMDIEDIGLLIPSMKDACIEIKE